MACRESVPDFTSGLQQRDSLGSTPLSGVRVGVIQQTMGEGVAAGVTAAVNGALEHMQQLGATVEQVGQQLSGPGPASWQHTAVDCCGQQIRPMAPAWSAGY